MIHTCYPIRTVDAQRWVALSFASAVVRNLMIKKRQMREETRMDSYTLARSKMKPHSD
jgi:hypothetical protein